MEPTQPTTRHDDDNTTTTTTTTHARAAAAAAAPLARSLARARARAVAVAMAVAIVAAYDARAFDDARAHATLTRGVCDHERAQRSLANSTRAFTKEQQPPFPGFPASVPWGLFKVYCAFCVWFLIGQDGVPVVISMRK